MSLQNGVETENDGSDCGEESAAAAAAVVRGVVTGLGEREGAVNRKGCAHGRAASPPDAAPASL